MSHEILDSVAGDLLSIPPLLRRGIHRKVFKEVFAGFAKDGITMPHFEIVETLRENDFLPVAAIGNRLQIPRPQMTHLIDKLVQLEMVSRQPDEDDRRIVNIALTEKGRATFEENAARIVGGVSERLSSLSPGELKELSASLRRLRDILSKLQ